MHPAKVIEVYCSNSACKKAICVDCIGDHHGHNLCPLSKVVSERAAALKAKMPVLAVYDAAITTGLGKVKKAKDANDYSIATCCVSISAAGDQQRNAVRGTPTTILLSHRHVCKNTYVYPRKLLTHTYIAFAERQLNANLAAIADNEAKLLKHVVEIPKHATLSGQHIDLSLAKMSVCALTETGAAALCYLELSNRFVKITAVLEA